MRARASGPQAWLSPTPLQSCLLTEHDRKGRYPHCCPDDRMDCGSWRFQQPHMLGQESHPLRQLPLQHSPHFLRPTQPQKTCSRSWTARSVLGAPCAGAHPHLHFQPLAGAHPCPRAPNTPCCKRRHHTSFQLLSQCKRFHTELIRAGRACTRFRTSGAGSGAGRSMDARDTADSTHPCQAVVLAALMSWSWVDVACLTEKRLAAMHRFPACSSRAPSWGQH